MAINVFLSVGRPMNSCHQEFLANLEALLTRSKLRPRTVGRSDFTHQEPLRLVNSLMDQCAGALILGWERIAIDSGWDQKGTKNQSSLEDVKLTTPWNQIEAAMSYAKRLPLLVIKDECVRAEGFLERGHGWFLHSAPLDRNFLTSGEFIGMFESWKSAVKRNAGWFRHRQRPGSK